MPDLEPPPIARALGRLPSGLYIVTTLAEGGPTGFLGSFVMQCGFEPPTVSLAVANDRPHLAAIRASGGFTLSILDAASRGLIGAFARRPAPGASPFDGQRLERAPSGAPILADALAWLDCRKVGEHALADHVVVFGEVLAGGVLRAGDPAVHLRRNGLSY